MIDTINPMPPLALPIPTLSSPQARRLDRWLDSHPSYCAWPAFVGSPGSPVEIRLIRDRGNPCGHGIPTDWAAIGVVRLTTCRGSADGTVTDEIAYDLQTAVYYPVPMEDRS